MSAMLSLPGSPRFCRVPVQKRKGQEKSDELRHNEARRIDGANTGERIGQRPRDRHRRIGKGGRGGKPIRSGNVSSDRERCHRLPVRAAAPNHRQQTKRRHHLGDPLREPCASMLGELPDRQIEHDMRQPYAQDGARDLGSDVGRHRMPA